VHRYDPATPALRSLRCHDYVFLVELAGNLEQAVEQVPVLVAVGHALGMPVQPVLQVA